MLLFSTLLIPRLELTIRHEGRKTKIGIFTEFNTKGVDIKEILYTDDTGVA